MILVTGTKRSGTSLWMQILAAGGLQPIGEAFPGTWAHSIGDANPRGFFESRFRQGVFYATNPDPKTGSFLAPQPTRRSVVKVFVPGLVRTDVAYLDRVVATMRHWREYGPSLRRLYALEDAWLRDNPREGMTGPQTVVWAAGRRSTLPPPVEWFLENFEIVRDVSTRRYPINLCTYEGLLAEPDKVIGRVFEWLGGGDVSAALTAIEPDLHRTRRAALDDDFTGATPDEVEVFDALFDAVHTTQRLDAALLERMNATWKALSERYGALSRDRGRTAGDGLDPREA